MNILEAYLKQATFIFIIHVILFVSCAYCLIKEYLLLQKESVAFNGLEKSGFTLPASDSGTAKLALLAAELSRKGQQPNADALRWQLLRLLTPYEAITRFCLNAFVVSGLLGTLYNLWQLSPEFWSSLLKSSSVAVRTAAPDAATQASQVGQPAIGIAFAASVFGLSAALFISFLDSFFIRHRRERFASDAAAKAFAFAARLMPPTEGAAVAQALDNFYRSSDSFLNKLKTDHEKLSAKFTKQVQDSSAALVSTLGQISGEWQTLSKAVAVEIGRNQTEVSARLGELSVAVSKTEQTLGAALPSLADAGKLAATLDTLRMKAASLQDEIATKFGEYSSKWREDLDQMTRAHLAQMESVYQKGWAQYSSESGAWHEKNVGALKLFAESVGASVSQWSDERAQAKQQVEGLLSAWRLQLGTALTGLGKGLADLNEMMQGLTKNSSQLAISNDIALHHLRDLQSAVASFDAEMLKGTSLGRAIDNIDATVAQLRDVVAGIKVTAPPVYVPDGRDDQLVEQILQEIRRLAAAVEELKKQGTGLARRPPPTLPDDQYAPPDTFETPEEPSRRSWGGRLLRFFHLRS